MPKIRQPSFYHQQINLQLWWMTAVLIALNAGLYLWQISTGVDPQQPSVTDALIWGADYSPLTFLEEPERLFTSIFFHFGFIHLALNMWALYIFGHIAEQIFGRFYFLSLYLLCGLSGSLLSSWLSIHNSYAFLQQHNLALLPHLNAGASGAVMGIGGALTILSFFPPLPDQSFILLKRTLLLVIGLNFGIGLLTPNINNAAHLGGLLMGALLGLIWMLLQQKQHPKLAIICGFCFGTLTVIAAYLYCQHLVVGIEPLWHAILEQMRLLN